MKMRTNNKMEMYEYELIQYKQLIGSHIFFIRVLFIFICKFIMLVFIPIFLMVSILICVVVVAVQDLFIQLPHTIMQQIIMQEIYNILVIHTSLLSLQIKMTNLLAYCMFISSVYAACNVGLAGCMSCADANNCASCFYGYGLNSVGGFQACDACSPANCVQCYGDYGICQVCDYGYRKVGATCQACHVTNCGNCDSNINTCSLCFGTYRYNSTNNICQRCSDSNCFSCPSNIDTCVRCSDPYGVSLNATCLPCSDSICLSCIYNMDYCERCDLQYGPSGGVCINCTDQNCRDCSSNAGVCNSCQMYYGQYSGNCYLCSTGITNCVQCYSDNLYYCTRCQPGYLASSGSCSSCMDSFCSECVGSTSNCVNCSAGYGLSSGNCIDCINPCVDCLGTNPNSCVTCIVGYYHDGSTSCIICMSNCLQCSNATYCSSCNTTFYYDTISSCLPCPLNCSSCQYDASSSGPSCTVCQVNHGLTDLVPRFCPEICGDYLAFDTPCDNQMGIAYDGCDDDCNVEYGFVCDKINYTSVCSYVNQTILEIVSLLRDRYTNFFTLRVAVWPPLYVFRTSDLTKVFRFSDSSLIIRSAVFEYAQSQLVLQVEFLNNFIDQEITLQFVPQASVDERYFASVNSTATLTTNLFFYEEFVLSSNRVIYQLCFVILGAGLLSLLLGLFTKRLPGLQAIIVCQIQVVALVFLDSLFFAPFSLSEFLKYSTGAHINIISQGKSQIQTSSRLLQQKQSPLKITKPPHLLSFGLDEKLLSNNFNIFLCLQLLPAICYLLTLVIIGCCDRRLKRLKQQNDEEALPFVSDHLRRANAVKEIFLQWLMYIGMFNLAYFTLCSALFFTNNSPPTEMTSLVVFSVGVLLYLITFLAFYFDPDPFDYFRYSFQRETLAMSFYFFYPLVIVSTVLLVVLLSEPWPSMIPAGCLLVFVIAYRPYRQRKDNIRCSLNLLTMLSCLGLRVFAHYFYNSASEVGLYAFIFHFINVILLLVVVLVGLAFLIWHIVHICLLKEKEKDEKQKVMCELDEINVRKQMKQIEKDDNVFKKLLEPRMNVVQFSNTINNICNQQLNELQQIHSTSRRVRRQMQAQKIRRHPNEQLYGSIKKIVEQKQKQIQEIKKQLEKGNEQEMQTQQQAEKKKLVYAMELVKNQNGWIRLKNARDYTVQKIKEEFGEKKKQFLAQYDRIPK